MPLWLYDLPNWQFGLLVIATWVFVGLACHELLHRLVPRTADEAAQGLAMTLLGVVATVNSLLLAFSAISVWDSFNSADKAVSSEASAVSQLARDLAVYDTAESRAARSVLIAYVHAVVDTEWPAMRQQQDSAVTWRAFDRIFHAVGQLEPASPRQQALMTEIWARTNELMRFRRDRLQASLAHVPHTLWAIVLIGTLLSLAPACVVPRTPFNRTAIAMLSLSMGLVFFFVAAMDRPFAGAESIGPAPFETSLASVTRWDLNAGH